MEYAIICSVALVASGLTLFSGFGLGTLLMPAFAIFFPVEIAVALTAIVHFFNNLFKLALLGKHASKTAILRLGLPAILAAFVGARILLVVSDLNPLARYDMLGRHLEILPVKIVIAVLMVLFALFELVPAFERMSLETKYLPLGGILSGFFGGLSGHQGALRSIFLLKCGLSKESFVGTGVVIACLVDLTRLAVYGEHFSHFSRVGNAALLVAATSSAFAGAFIGNRLLKKVTLRTIQLMVSTMLLVIAVALAMGIL